MKLKETEYYPIEFAYSCPYCNNEQGYCMEIEKEELKETHFCDKCKKEFKVTK